MNNFEVNTSEVRRAARTIARIEDSVRALSKQDVKKMRAQVREDMDGEMADALSDVLGSLSMDISRLAAGLSDVKQVLNEYARRMDEADKEIASLIDK